MYHPYAEETFTNIACGCCHEEKAEVNVTSFKHVSWVEWEHWINIADYICIGCLNEYSQSHEFLLERFVKHGFYPEFY